MADGANAETRQQGLIERYLDAANSINDLQWEGILVRALRYRLDKQALALIGAITACAKLKNQGLPGFGDELNKVFRSGGPKIWLRVLEALASREDEQDRVAYFTIAPLYYLTLAIVIEGDNCYQASSQGAEHKNDRAQPSWWHQEGY